MKLENFNADDYLTRYPEVAALGLNAWEHYQDFGRRLGYFVAPDVSFAESRIIKDYSLEKGANVVFFAAYVNGAKFSALQRMQLAMWKSAGFIVCTAVSCERLAEFEEDGDGCDFLLARTNMGFDFGAWRELCSQFNDVSELRSLTFVNDSIFPVLDLQAVEKMFVRIVSSQNDVLFATQSLEIKEHEQSFLFSAQTPKGISTIRSTILEAKSYHTKESLINEFELEFGQTLASSGAKVGHLYSPLGFNNPTTEHWEELLDLGFPFVKVSAATEALRSGQSEKLRRRLGASLWDNLLKHVQIRQAASRNSSGNQGDRTGVQLDDRSLHSEPKLIKPYLSTENFNHCLSEFEAQLDPSLTPIQRRQARISHECRLKLDFTVGDLRAGPVSIAVLVPVYNVAPRWLNLMVGSVLSQTYINWELILVDDGSTKQETLDALRYIITLDSRIKVVFQGYNGGIAAATNNAFFTANSDYIALVDNDDLLTCDALERIVDKIRLENFPDLVYSNEFKIDEQGNVSDLFAKPGWSPFLLLNSMYTGHLSVYKSSIVEQAGCWRTEYDFSQDYDLALRVSEITDRVVHLDEFLYAWRMIPGSAAQGDKPDARKSNIAALQDACNRRGWQAEAIALPTANRVVWSTEKFKNTKVSIIIPSDSVANIVQSVSSITSKTSFADYEILIVTKTSVWAQCGLTLSDKIRHVPYDLKFNFSDKCNVGSEVARGEYLVFFNDDVRVVSSDWLTALLEYASLPGIGAVGPKLLYENNTIQHAGMVTGVRRLVGTAFHCLPHDTSFHFNLAQFVREVSLICGALLAIRKTTYDEVSGMDSINAGIAHSDVDLCLRLMEHGYRNIYTPHATLIHIGHVSIGEDEIVDKKRGVVKREKNDLFIIDRFGKLIANDQYFPKYMLELAYHDSQESYQLYVPNQPSGKTMSASNGKSALIVSHDLTASGAPLVAFDIASYFQKCGFQTHCITPTDGHYRSRYLDLGVPLIVDPLILSDNEDSTFYLHNYDFVVLNTILCWKLVKRLREITSVTWYVHEIGLIDHLVATEPGLRQFLSTGVEAICTSELIAAKLRQYGVKAKVLEPGVHDEHVKSTHSRCLRIGVFGSVEPRKGQDIAIEAIQSIEKATGQRVRLEIIGRTLDHAFNEEIRKRAGAAPNIHFIGEMTPSDCLKKMDEVDVVFVPSREEALSLVAIEGLSKRKVVVLAETTGVSAYLQHERSGMVAKIGTPDEFSAMFQRLIEDPELVSRIGTAGRTVYEQVFSIDAFHQKLDQLFPLEIT